MQIVREGCGTKIQDGETRQVATRFTETNLSNGNVLSNTFAEFAYITEIFLAMKSNGTIVAQFQPGSGAYAPIEEAFKHFEKWPKGTRIRRTRFPWHTMGRTSPSGLQTGERRFR